MILETKLSDEIMNFLKQELVLNQNIIGVIENSAEAKIYVDNVDNPKGVLVSNGYFHYIYSRDNGFIDYAADNFFKEGFFGFSGIDMTIAERIRRKHTVTWENQCALYYMPEENLDLNLIKNETSDIDIKDAEIIDKLYQYRNDWSLEAIKKDIVHRSSSAVYVDGDIACWVLVHEDNSMGIMFTKEEYRRRGYAVDVTIDLASKIIKSGKIPYIQIVKGNNMSPGLAQKCGFVECGKVVWFGIVAGTPKELIDSGNECKNKLLEPFTEVERGMIFKPDKKYKSMYLYTNGYTNNYNAQAIEIQDVKTEGMLELWMELVRRKLGSMADADSFMKKLEASIDSEGSSYEPYLCTCKGEAVAAFMGYRLDEEVIGLYTLYIDEADGEIISECIGKAVERLKDSYMLVLFEAPYDKKDIYRKHGAKSSL